METPVADVMGEYAPQAVAGRVERIVYHNPDNGWCVQIRGPEAGGKVEDREAVLKALKNPSFKSVRGEFRFGANQFPVQDYYLRTIGHLVFSFAWCGAAGVAMRRLADPATANDPFYKAKINTARFYFAKLYPESASLIAQARAGSGALMEMDAEAF